MVDVEMLVVFVLDGADGEEVGWRWKLLGDYLLLTLQSDGLLRVASPKTLIVKV